MFGDSDKTAREAKDIATRVERDHQNHVAVCLDNQRRIESRFSGIETKLDRQNDEFAKFKDAQISRLDAIKSNDNKRFVTMMGVMGTTVAGVAVQILFHFWK